MKTTLLVAAMAWLLSNGAVLAADAPPGASSCSGCHAASATVASPVPRLVGRNPDEIVSAMLAFRTGKQSGTIMDRIAKGFSDDEIRAIAAWYGAQK